MGYHLGVDLGTTFTAAAVMNGGGPTMLGLGNRALQIPSVLYFHPDGSVLVGEAAELRSASDPSPDRAGVQAPDRRPGADPGRGSAVLGAGDDGPGAAVGGRQGDRADGRAAAWTSP